MKISPPSATITANVSSATTTATGFDFCYCCYLRVTDSNSVSAEIRFRVRLRLDAAGYLSSSVASVVQPLEFSFTELLLSGVLALQLHYVWSLSLLQFSCDGHAFESPNFFKSRKTEEHAAVNVALMSFPFDGFQEIPVWEGLQEQEVICSTTRIRVYPCVPDISFPNGITVLQISKIGG
ncbi:hypothetical protein Q3G72_008569 [Acer saccharum]|nr:hypothetical protein Q3G72_008569 [Acer saccharum]